MSKHTPERAVALHRTMTPHQMALRIVELEDALELIDKALLAKQSASPAVPEGWQLVPNLATDDMLRAWLLEDSFKTAYRAMLAAAPKLEGGAA